MIHITIYGILGAYNYIIKYYECWKCVRIVKIWEMWDIRDMLYEKLVILC